MIPSHTSLSRVQADIYMTLMFMCRITPRHVFHESRHATPDTSVVAAVAAAAASAASAASASAAAV